LSLKEKNIRKTIKYACFYLIRISFVHGKNSFAKRSKILAGYRSEK